MSKKKIKKKKIQKEKIEETERTVYKFHIYLDEKAGWFRKHTWKSVHHLRKTFELYHTFYGDITMEGVFWNLFNRANSIKRICDKVKK